jgi:hypothetical protein
LPEYFCKNFDKNFLFLGRSIRQAALCVNGIHTKQVYGLPIEMLHQEWKFRKQHYRESGRSRKEK